MDYYIDDALSIGRIEICYEGTWRSLCSNDWSRQDASVACRQLGFAAAGQSLYYYYYTTTTTATATTTAATDDVTV